jgi:hypothetical protein
MKKFFHFLVHDWSKWVTTNSGTFTRSGIFTDKVCITGWFEKQKRACGVCGKVQLHVIETDL